MIEIDALYKTFYQNTPRAFSALKNISLQINEGELVILQGVSGSGKSTLLSLIAALQKPTSGSLKVAGELISKLPDLHASHFRAVTIGFVPQSFNLFENLSVQENMSVALIPLGYSPREIQEKSITALKKAHIYHKKDAIVHNLSGGEKQRTAIARALVNDAKIILCDEPTAALDHHNSMQFIDIITQLKNLGKTIIIATHDPRFEALSAIDQTIYMREGEIYREQ